MTVVWSCATFDMGSTSFEIFEGPFRAFETDNIEDIPGFPTRHFCTSTPAETGSVFKFPV